MQPAEANIFLALELGGVLQTAWVQLILSTAFDHTSGRCLQLNTLVHVQTCVDIRLGVVFVAARVVLIVCEKQRVELALVVQSLEQRLQFGLIRANLLRSVTRCIWSCRTFDHYAVS